MDDFVNDTVPPTIRLSSNHLTNDAIPPLSESELYKRAKELGAQNKIMRSYIGMGYHNAGVPPIILRNVSSCRRTVKKSPYQPEIAQG